MTRDEFDLWLKDPVTRWVIAGVKRAQGQEKAEWVRQSWDSGTADPMQLLELRTRSEALGELYENDFETWSAWNGEEVSSD